MDPLSQAVLGASLSQSFANNKTKQRSALVIGALAGMSADLDILIRSKADPLLFLEFHRQFTHSLIFIPIGALLCALVFNWFTKLNWFKTKWPSANFSFSEIYVFSFLGYATHGLLDACTSYGTQLLWPFSNERIAWNTVSIIDPLFTIPILILVMLAVFRKNKRYAQTAFAYAVIFLSVGIIQHDRAITAVQQLAENRGHQIQRVLAKPTFANRHLWKIIYEHDGRYYVDAVKLLNNVTYIPGTSIAKLNIKRDLPWLPKQSQQAKDLERFRWFSNDYLAASKNDPDFIMDVRYSFVPNQIKWLWGIKLDTNKSDTHVDYVIQSRPDKVTTKRFFDILL